MERNAFMKFPISFRKFSVSKIPTRIKGNFRRFGNAPDKSYSALNR